MSELISEADLAKIEAAALQARRTSYDHVPAALASLACDSVPLLVAEVRRLNLQVEAAEKILSGGYEQGMNGLVINRNQADAWLKGDAADKQPQQDQGPEVEPHHFTDCSDSKCPIHHPR